jgi:hypothetical protein
MEQNSFLSRTHLPPGIMLHVTVEAGKPVVSLIYSEESESIPL